MTYVECQSKRDKGSQKVGLAAMEAEYHASKGKAAEERANAIKKKMEHVQLKVCSFPIPRSDLAAHI